MALFLVSTCTKGELAISSSILIRLGGLVAIMGGLAATTLGLLYVLQAWGMTLDSTAMALLKGHYENPVTNMLLVGVLAAIMALHIIQKQYYGRWGILVFLGAIVGVAMILVDQLLVAFSLLFVIGLLVATVGIIALGAVTLSAGVLPRWCGVALLAGSPPGVGILFVFFTPLGMTGILPGEIFWALLGIPWIVVGYAAFRAASRGTVRSARVR
jgi:hypothetical protein